MRICYFGTYDADYVRNRVIIAGLSAAGVQVVECHVPLWQETADKVSQAAKGLVNPRLAWRFLRTYSKLWHVYRGIGAYDAMIVGYAGHVDVFPARILTWLARKPLVLDVFLSVHETVTQDRGLAAGHSLFGRMLYLMEKAGCQLANRLFLDTEADIQYLAQKYGLPLGKFTCVPVGADESVYFPTHGQQESPFTAIYFGKFIPLHGVEHVVAAAKELEVDPEIQIEFIGDGQTYEAMRALATDLQVRNITWGPRWLEPEELRTRIAQAAVCLGIFGTSDKAQRVIPTKAYVALAMGKPLITADSPAAREVFTSGKDAILCPAGDSAGIAQAILALKRDEKLRGSVAEAGHRLFVEQFTTQAIGAQVKESLATLLQA
jgi:glycosyltransferase involved in cell wall biosynthesis